MEGVDQARPQPVLDAAKLGGLVSAAVIAVGGAVFLVLAGITTDTIGVVGVAIGAAVTAVTALVVYLVSVIQGRKVSARVTPLDDPRDDRGVQLVPVDGYGEHAADAPAGADPRTVASIRRRLDAERPAT